MAFDSKYYNDKKMKVVQDFVKAKDKALVALVDINLQLAEAQDRYTRDMEEINAIIAEAAKVGDQKPVEQTPTTPEKNT